jgi:hypothetical protein
MAGDGFQAFAGAQNVVLKHTPQNREDLQKPDANPRHADQ